MAFLPLACGQGSQNAAPPAAAATQAAAVETADAAAAVAPDASTEAPAEAQAAPSVSTPAASTAAAPVKAPASKPAAAAASSSAPPAPAAAAAAQPAAATTAPLPPPARVRLTIPAGTLLPIEIATTLSSATSQDGDPVLAVLTEDVALEGFKLDKGAEVRGRVLTAIPAKRVKGQARLAVTFDAIMENGEKLSIETEAIDNMAASTSSKDKKVIAGGAAGGLILGAIKDGKKGAVVGTVLGAAAGTGAVLIMKGDEVELPRGTRVTVAVTK